MAKTIKNYGKSVKERLLNISRAEQYSSQLLISRYFQERLLYRLSVSSYKDKFILKGGALLYAHDGFQARPTLDIDFMAKNISNDLANIEKIFQEICQIECKEDGVMFDFDTIETSEIAITKEYHGVRLSLLAHLDTAQQSISIILSDAIKATFANRGTEYKENHPLFEESFFADSNRSMYWKGFLKRIKYSKPLSFTDVGTLIRTRLQPYWNLLCPKNSEL